MTKKLNTEGTIQAVSTLCNGGVEILIDADTQFVTVELDEMETIDLIEQLANKLGWIPSSCFSIKDNPVALCREKEQFQINVYLYRPWDS